MLGSFFSKKISKVFLTLAVFGLLVFLNPKNFFDSVRDPFVKIAYFFEKTLQVSAEKTSYFFSTIASVGSLKRENDALSQENSRLFSENIDLKVVRDENEELRKQMNLLPRQDFELESAEVISKSSSSMNDWVIINKGSDQGLEVGMSVVVSDGIMVGKLSEVLPDRSKVVFLTNASSAVNAFSLETKAKGILKGEYGVGMVLDMVLETSALAVGNNVVTTKMDATPQGLLIGKISEVHPSSDYLFQQAIVVSPVDFSDLQFVSVIKKAKYGAF